MECKICHKPIKKERKYCSHQCYSLNMVGHENRNTGRTHFKKGLVPWNKGMRGLQIAWNKDKPHTKVAGEKSHLWKGGRPKCNFCKKILSSYKASYCSRHKGRLTSGEKNPNWKGGITAENHKIRSTVEYRTWRNAVFVRDNWTCQACGVRGAELHADHIKPFCLFPELRLAIDNGRTLCVPCHRKTPTYGDSRSFIHLFTKTAD